MSFSSSMIFGILPFVLTLAHWLTVSTDCGARKSSPPTFASKYCWASPRNDGLMALAKELGAPFELVQEVHQSGKLPVVNFAAGGVATPADAALMMQLGAEGVFVGSGIFKSGSPAVMARAIVKATTHYQDPKIIADVSRNLGEAMRGLDVKQIPADQLLATRGW